MSPLFKGAARPVADQWVAVPLPSTTIQMSEAAAAGFAKRLAAAHITKITKLVWQQKRGSSPCSSSKAAITVLVLWRQVQVLEKKH
jgi:hypothetical protein